MKVSVEKQRRSSKGPSKGGAPQTANISSPVEFELSEGASVLDLKNQIQKKMKVPVVQQRLTIDGGKKVLEDKSLVKNYELEDKVVALKDLGPQISWKAVFLIEYGGPILIHLAIYKMQSLFYGQKFVHSPAQRAMFFMAIFHYLKREYETLFVHRFSHGTMPFSNLFKNCFHYYVLGGVLLAYFNYMPSGGLGTPVADNMSSFRIAISILLFIASEFSNYSTHVTLKNLRPAGSTVRKIPYGYGFDMVSCPNYLFEILSWLSYAIISPSYFTWLFIIVSSAQMYLWAVKKHKAYKKEFPNYPKSRKALFPYIA
ncbi:putative enoyl reductase [Smittium mucronatum]|uniref:Putative enoyl reductase n=1 Tax=Smittium mucronatum TaxID=133383 RepID=A0A1R0H7Y9_9FUNG|nr:putative enoyl reductase [Smittium mucronatum]